MVTDYRIFYGDFIHDMELKVCDSIKEGYEPQGGICVIYTHSRETRFYQVVVKRGK